MPNPNDMENAGVSRIDDAADTESSMAHDTASAASNAATSTALKKAKGKHGKKGGKSGDNKSSGKTGDGKQGDSQPADEQDSSPKGLKPGDDAKGEKSDAQSAKTGAKAAKTGANAASAAVKGGMLMKMMNFFQMALAMGANAMSSILAAPLAFLNVIGQFVHGVVSTVTGAASAVAGFVSSAVSAVAGFFGVGTTAATVTVIGTSLTAAVAAVAIAASVVMGTTNTAQRDGVLEDCRVAVAEAMEAGEVDADAQMLNNAKAIYSVLSTYGLSDEQVAGVLGNFSTESGIDPTTIEGIYDEDYNINGPRHQEAMADFDAYVKGPLSDAYAGFTGSGGPVKNPGGYTSDADGKMYPGLGMGQYTGGGAKVFLDFAESVGVPWYTVDFQLAYTLAKGAPASGAGFWERYQTETAGQDAAACARYFSQYWEGNTSNAWSERQESATSWASQMSSWSADLTYGQSVIAMAERLGATATDNNVANKKSTCVKTINADNSSIANAAVSYAYETQDEGRGNNGTELYQRVHDAIWGAGDIYQSCDRGVATAVRWSGSDDTYPAGDTGRQLQYLLTSDKWEKVGSSGSLTMEDLLPGDVFCLDGHTFLYVGNEAVKAKYPESNGDSVSASYCERSPGVGVDSSDIIERMHGQDWIGRGEYQVFRCVKPDHSTTYANAGSAVD